MNYEKYCESEYFGQRKYETTGDDLGWPWPWMTFRIFKRGFRCSFAILNGATLKNKMDSVSLTDISELYGHLRFRWSTMALITRIATIRAKTANMTSCLAQFESFGLYIFVKNHNLWRTVVCLKSGLACVAIFGESPDFLDKSFFAKIQKSGFLGKVLFFQNAKVRIFWKSPVFKKAKSPDF